MARKSSKAKGRTDGIRWLSAADPRLTVRGLAWFGENGGSFCRLPLRAKDVVRPDVWTLAQQTAGGRLAFRSDATAMSVRATTPNPGHMPHMPSTGSNGLSLYCGAPGRMRPWATAVPDMEKGAYECQLFAAVAPRMREFILYMPLYKELQALELGVNRGARILKPSRPAVERPVVFYGTSITQGGCASTAGSDFVSIVGRLLNIDVVNLGFSGNGTGDAEVAELMSEIDAALYVLDYAGNTDAKGLNRTLPRFIDILRARRPTAPILIMTCVCFSRYDFSPAVRDGLEQKRDVMIEHYVRRRRRGDPNVHLVDGFGLIPFGTDAAYVDGVHPADHGFRMMAERLAPFIEQILLRDTP